MTAAGGAYPRPCPTHCDGCLSGGGACWLAVLAWMRKGQR